MLSKASQIPISRPLEQSQPDARTVMYTVVTLMAVICKARQGLTFQSAFIPTYEMSALIYHIWQVPQYHTITWIRIRYNPERIGGTSFSFISVVHSIKSVSLFPIAARSLPVKFVVLSSHQLMSLELFYSFTIALWPSQISLNFIKKLKKGELISSHIFSKNNKNFPFVRVLHNISNLSVSLTLFFSSRYPLMSLSIFTKLIIKILHIINNYFANSCKKHQNRINSNVGLINKI